MTHMRRDNLAVRRGTRRAIARLQQSTLTRAFSAWHCAVAERQERALAVQKALAFWQHACMGPAFRSWAEAAPQLARERLVVRTVLARISNR